jgi:glycerophosphoryl diester phosphodiesterase
MSTSHPTLHAGFLTRPLAHRGFHDRAAGRPENSRAAFVAAIENGFGIELDLQLSRDARAMVFHDYDLGRLTAQKGPIQQRTAAELANITLTGGAEGIPTLTEVLTLVAGRTPLLIEIKDQDGAMGAAVGKLEQAAATALAGYGGPVAVMSFNPHSVRQMAGFSPSLARGITTSAYTADDWPMLPAGTRDRLRDIPDYDSTGACFISHEAEDLASARVADLRARGAAILCWTIRSAAQEAAARRVAHNITFEGYVPQSDVRD